MTSDVKSGESYKPVKSILISQPKPTGSRNSFFALEEKFDIKIDWRQFIHVEPVTEKEFRKNRLRPDDFSAVIFTSRQSIDHFFRMCEEMRVKMSAETKYFCISKAVANYLQKFIVYRKRKVFVGKKVIEDLTPAINKHKDKLKFLLPCSNLGATQIVEYLKELKIDFKDVMMFRTLMSDLSDLEDVTYDILVFFSPLGIDSLYQNFPDFKQNETRIAVFGNKTFEAVQERGLVASIKAPSKESPSMTMALENYLKLANGK